MILGLRIGDAGAFHPTLIVLSFALTVQHLGEGAESFGIAVGKLALEALVLKSDGFHLCGENVSPFPFTFLGQHIRADTRHGRCVVTVAGEVYVVEVASEKREQIQRSADAALTAVLAVRQVVVDLDAVLGHDQFVDFISALQFLSEQFAVTVGIGDAGLK